MPTFCWTSIGPKIKIAQNLLKFGTLDISNMPISIIMSKMIFDELFTNCQAEICPKLKGAEFIQIRNV